MSSIPCDVCLGKEGHVQTASFLHPLLDKHLGILVQARVKSCAGCIQLLQMWDDFSNQAKQNLRITHPTANFQLRNDNVHSSTGSINTTSSSSKAATVVLDIDDDSDSNEVMICGDDDDDIIRDSHTQSDACTSSSRLPVQEKTSQVDLELACVFEEPLMRVAPPVVWDIPSILPEDNVSEPATDPLNLLTVQVKEEPCDIDILAPHVKQEADLEVDPLNQLDVKPTIPVLHSDSQVDTPKYSCSLCSKKFLSQKCLNIHIKSKHRKRPIENKTKSTVVYQCPQCETRLTSQEALTHHISLHDSSDALTPEPVKLDSIHLCELCCKSFRNQEILQIHMQNVHLQGIPSEESEPNIVQCPFCFHNYTNLKTLERHISMMHPDPTTMAFVSKKNSNVICDICNVNLCSKRVLKYHILNVHLDILNNSSQKCSRTQIYPCQICNIKLRSLELMKRHLIQDHKLNQCNDPTSVHKNDSHTVIDVTKSDEPKSVNNAASSVQKYFKCKICDQVCTSREAIQQHKLEKHALKNTRYGMANNIKFSCAPCLKTFDSKANLDNHNKKSHNVVVPLEESNEKNTKKKESGVLNVCKDKTNTTCHICDRKFKTNRGMTHHLLWHEEKLNSPLQTRVDIVNLDETPNHVDKPKSKSEVSPKYKIYEDKFKKRDGMYFCNFCMKSLDSLNKIVFHLTRDHLPKNYAQVMKARMKNTNEGESSKDCLENCESHTNVTLLTKRTKLDENSTGTSTTDIQSSTSKQNTTEEILLDLITNEYFACCFCKKILSTMDDIYHHCSRNHEEKMKRIKTSFCISCIICADNKMINSMATLGSHIESKHKQQNYTSQTKTKNLVKPCNSKEISDMLNNKEVMPDLEFESEESTASTLKIFNCSFCKKQFYSKTAMECHVQKSHLNKKRKL